MRRGWVCAGAGCAQGLGMRRGWVCAGAGYAQGLGMRRGWVCAGAGCAQGTCMRRICACAGAGCAQVLGIGAFSMDRAIKVCPHAARTAHRATCRMQHTTYNIGASSLAQTAATRRAPLALPCARPAAPGGIGRAARSWTSCTRSRAQDDTTCRCVLPWAARGPRCATAIPVAIVRCVLCPRGACPRGAYTAARCAARTRALSGPPALGGPCFVSAA